MANKMKAAERISKYLASLDFENDQIKKVNKLEGMLEVARACGETKLVKIIRERLNNPVR